MKDIETFDVREIAIDQIKLKASCNYVVIGTMFENLPKKILNHENSIDN